MLKYAPIPLLFPQNKGVRSTCFGKTGGQIPMEKKQKPGPKALSGPLPMSSPKAPSLCEFDALYNFSLSHEKWVAKE